MANEMRLSQLITQIFLNEALAVTIIILKTIDVFLYNIYTSGE
jgi:hypothetical protein